MSFLKQILKPFVEFDEAHQKEDGPQKQAPSAPSNESGSEVKEIPLPYDESFHPLVGEALPKESSGSVPSYSPSGRLDDPLPEHVHYFEQLLDHANASNPAFAGVDYREFINNKLDIDDIPDDALKYRTAYNVLKGSGLTKAKLLQTGQQYMDLIGRDLNNFQSAQAIKYTKELAPKEDHIQRKAEELLVLQQQVNKIKGEINALTQELNMAWEKMNTARSSFLLAGERKQSEIAGELKKIDQYFER